MAIEIKVPEAGESIIEVMISEWLKKEGDYVEQDEPIVLIDTDKTSMEVPAPQSGTLEKILKGNDADAEVGEVIGIIDETASKPAGAQAKAAPAAPPEAAPTPATSQEATVSETEAENETGAVMPAARRLLEQHGLEASAVQSTGPGGRLLKEDVQRHIDQGSAPPTMAAPKNQAKSSAEPITPRASGSRDEETVRMTPLRRKVAERLVSSQQNAALLTTFNEVDMSAVKHLRKQYKEAFLAKHGIKLGFMSFFVKATIEALKAVPQVNAEIRDDKIVFRNYQDIGVAVGGGKGLVVPVIRNAEHLSFAEVELTIADLAKRARDNKLKLEELQGGTFTISNGGIYGSLLSTPIINPPQSGILGMHKIEDRPVAVDGQVVIRPMMYLALTYDHRLIDGREAVTFLVRIKECIENPTRILLEV